jgi:hypothetical protein
MSQVLLAFANTMDAAVATAPKFSSYPMEKATHSIIAGGNVNVLGELIFQKLALLLWICTIGYGL